MKRKEYKSAPNMFTETTFSREHYENVYSILNSHFTQLVQGISESRKIEANKVKSLIDEGPFLPNEAKEHKFIDEVTYSSSFLEEIGKTHPNAILLPIQDYLVLQPSQNSIAILKIVGTINEGLEHEINAYLASILSNPNIKGLIVRIDSPGGGFVESDGIYHSLQVVKKKKNFPVVASLSSEAASGAYYIACACDYIGLFLKLLSIYLNFFFSFLVAQPATLTGSIGVFSLGVHFDDFLKDYGINLETVSIGKNANYQKDFTEDVMKKMLDFTYNQFSQIVANSRNLTLEQVEALAQGKTFTGAQAKEIKLIDELGGLQRAIQIVQERANLEQLPNVLILPKEKSKFEILKSFFLK